MKKSKDNYNISGVKAIAHIINNGRATHEEKEQRIAALIDAVYVDGWNHGYGKVADEERESLSLKNIVEGRTITQKENTLNNKGGQDEQVS